MIQSRQPHHRTRRSGTVSGLLAAALTLAALAAPAQATGPTFMLLDDFEGDQEINRYPIRALRNWTIIDSVDLKTERTMPPLCGSTGTCIDLIGTTDQTSGGLLSKTSYPVGTYLLGFMLYGSGRDITGATTPGDGIGGQIQVSFGARSVYANNDIPSDFAQFVVLRVHGSGKLRFRAVGGAPNIGPLLDNVVLIQLGTPAP